MRAVSVLLFVAAVSLYTPRAANADCTCDSLLAAVCPPAHKAASGVLYESVEIITTDPKEPTRAGILSNLRNKQTYRVHDPTSKSPDKKRNPTMEEWALKVAADPSINALADSTYADEMVSYRAAKAKHLDLKARYGVKYEQTAAYYNAHIQHWRTALRAAFKTYLTRYMTTAQAESVMVAVDDFQIILGDAFDASPGSRQVTVGRKELAIAIGGYPQHIMLALAHEWAHCFDPRIQFFGGNALPPIFETVFGAVRNAIRGAYPTLHDDEESMAAADGYEVWADWFATQALSELKWTGDDYMRGFVPLCSAGNARGYPSQDQRMKLFGLHSRESVKALCGGSEKVPVCPPDGQVPAVQFPAPAYMPKLPARPKAPNHKSIAKAVIASQKAVKAAKAAKAAKANVLAPAK